MKLEHQRREDAKSWGSPDLQRWTRPRFGLRQSSAAFGRLAPSESARGLAQSKTWRPHARFMESPPLPKEMVISPHQRSAGSASTRHSLLRAFASSLFQCRSQQAVALVVTLIMLAIITVVVVAYLALARRDRLAAVTADAQTRAELMADTARERALVEVAAQIGI